MPEQDQPADEPRGAGEEQADDEAASSKRPEWADDAEDALGRVRESLKAAWHASRDARTGALEAARQAATQLGAALDQGVDAAKSQWGSAEPGDDDAADAAEDMPADDTVTRMATDDTPEPAAPEPDDDQP